MNSLKQSKMSEVKFDEKKFEEQLKAASDKLENVTKALEGKADAEDIKSIQETLSEVKDSVNALGMIEDTKLADYVKNIQKQANACEVELKELRKTKGTRKETLQDHIKSIVESDDYKNSIKTGNKHQFVLKADNDLLTSDFTADTGTVGLPQMLIPGVTRHPWRDNPCYAAVTKRTVGMEHEVTYIEELTRSDAAAIKAEGSAYAESGATWITKKLGFYDIGHHSKHTRELMEDAQYATEAINDLLYNGLLRKLESQLLVGTGSSQMTGLTVYAKTFAKPAGLKAVANASIDDCLRVGKLQVARGYMDSDSNKKGYGANFALIGPSTMANRELEKDTIGRRLLQGIDVSRVAGMIILESQDLTESETHQYFLVGDFSKATLYLKRNLIIESGLDGNDFTYGMSTIRASVRGGLLVKNLETYAFVYGDLVTAPALIEA